jgi:hypothetical protein
LCSMRHCPPIYSLARRRIWALDGPKRGLSCLLFICYLNPRYAFSFIVHLIIAALLSFCLASWYVKSCFISELVFLSASSHRSEIKCRNFVLQMGDPSVEVTEESRDASQEAKGMAMEAMSEGSLVCYTWATPLH